MRVQIKVFESTMQSGYARVEADANAFLKTLDDTAVISVTPALCAVGNQDDEFYQAFAVTVVYRAN
jgi:hypothetical protein